MIKKEETSLKANDRKIENYIEKAKEYFYDGYT
jgi:hypothetical protein